MNPFRTRMNRSQFAISILLTFVIAYISFALIFSDSIWTILGIVLAIYLWTFPTRRLNDAGMSNIIWLAPCLFLPFLFIPLYIFLLIKKSDPMPNKWGEVPSGFSIKSLLIG
jgi:uncharacterized membrane protein YhaH (DUF805 family)